MTNLKVFLTAIILSCCVFMSNVTHGDEIQRQSDIPKEVYYKFIKKVRPHISDHEMKDIFRAVEYYVPRYFGAKGIFEESLTWILPAIAQESTFRNQNGDEGRSIGYMMVTLPTCDTARRHNGIMRPLNLISKWDNIHCGLAEMNRLYEHPIINGDWELVIRGYNSGTEVLKYPRKYARGNRMNKVHLSRIKKYRKMLLEIIENYEINRMNEDRKRIQAVIENYETNLTNDNQNGIM